MDSRLRGNDRKLALSMFKGVNVQKACQLRKAKSLDPLNPLHSSELGFSIPTFQHLIPYLLCHFGRREK